MKVLYIESKRRSQGKFGKIENILLNQIPKTILIFYTIQHKETAFAIRKELEAKNYNIRGFRHILGCSELNIKGKETTTPILLIGGSRFHALSLALQSNSPIYIYRDCNLEKISEKDIEILKQKRRGALARFFNSSKIGILVSIKPGQNNLERALKIKKRLESTKKNEKQFYLFVSNNINTSELENFNMDSWINTACPGLALDNPSIINLNDLFQQNI